MKYLGGYPCLFTIDYYNTVEEKVSTEQGFIYADSMTQAAEIIEEYYGVPDRLELHLYEGGIPHLPKDLFDNIKEFFEGE